LIEVESVDFMSVPSQDIERSRAFYLETLELPLDRDMPLGFEVMAGQLCLSVWQPEKMGLPFAPTPNPIAFRVADVAATRAELEAKGVEFRGETLDTSVCHMAFFHDPDGNAIMLHRRYAPHE
jgi:catechol 2,3-dioxygenase-like lactoylglutathione lyase family enzyme